MASVFLNDLIIRYEYFDCEDDNCLILFRKKGEDVILLKCLYGNDANKIYDMLFSNVLEEKEW